MIRQLRRRHRTIILVLAIALAVLFIAALSVRPKPSKPNTLRLPQSGGAR